MRKVRKIYTWEEGWDVIFKNQEEILIAPGKSKMNPCDVNAIDKGMNKIFRENASAKIPTTVNAPFTNITNKLNNVSNMKKITIILLMIIT